ncbi:glycosyl transferase [Bacteroidia bacterium]|nr:glycosyl transferase [Bacteroidia bacterium]
MSPKVSILVPIYNVSPFIERCTHSLFNQTFQNIEYIFVNDCTPDDSIEKLQKIIEQYPQRKGTIKIINHKINRGLAATRNTAIDNSNGKYLLQADSDDYIEPDMVELLYCKAEETQADITVCDFFEEHKNKNRVIADIIADDMDKNRSNIIKAITTRVCIWNKLIKRELYNRCTRLPEGLNYGEDRYITTQLYFLANKIAKVNKPLYHYIQYNTVSITAKSRNSKHFENAFQCWNFLSDFLKKQHSPYLEQLNFAKIQHKASLMINTNSYSLRKKYAKMFYEEETKYYPQLKHGKRVITFLTRHRLFFLAQVYHWGVHLFNKFNSQS